MFVKKSKFYAGIFITITMCSFTACTKQQPDDLTPDNAITIVPEPSGTPEDSILPDETITLNVFSELSSFRGIQEGWFAEIMEEKFNVRLNIITSDSENTSNPYDGTYDLIISAAYHGENFEEAMEKGCFLDLNAYDMKSYMPYISEHLENSYIYDSDASGHIYGISASTTLPGDYTDLFYTWDLRYDYYEELGKPEISDIDDWVDVLAQMKDAHPVNDAGDEIYGISYHADWDEGMLFGVQTFVCAYYGYEANGMGFYDWENNKYYGTLAMEENGDYGPYLQMLKLNHELYQKGLLDPDSETQDYANSVTAKTANGQVLASLTTYSGSYLNDLMYPVVPKEARLLAYELEGSHRSISIDSQTMYPELCMAILDYFYSPEGMLTMGYGPMGECWDYDADGFTYLTEFGTTCLFERYTLRGDMYFADGAPMFNLSPYNFLATNTDNGEPYDFNYWKNTITEPANETERAWREWTQADSVQKYANSLEPYVIIPHVNAIHFSDTELSQQYEAVSNIIISQSWEAIKAPTTEEFDRIVQAMIADATQAGYEKCVEYCENYYQSIQK